LNCFAKDNSISIKVDLCKTADSTTSSKSFNLSMNLNVYNSSVLKRNYMSLDALNDATKKRNNHIFTRQSECFTKSLVNDLVVENKLEKGSSDIMEKVEQRYAMKMHTAGNSLLNIKINNYTLQPSSSIELKRIAKSQFLKTHVSEILFKDNRFPKHSQKIQNVGNTYVTNYTSSNNANNVQIRKNNSMNAKLRVAASSPSAFKLDLSENIKLDKINNNVSDTPSDGHIRFKYKNVKENEKSITNCLKSLVSIEESAENN